MGLNSNSVAAAATLRTLSNGSQDQSAVSSKLDNLPVFIANGPATEGPATETAGGALGGGGRGGVTPPATIPPSSSDAGDNDNPAYTGPMRKRLILGPSDEAVRLHGLLGRTGVAPDESKEVDDASPDARYSNAPTLTDSSKALQNTLFRVVGVQPAKDSTKDTSFVPQLTRQQQQPVAGDNYPLPAHQVEQPAQSSITPIQVVNDALGVMSIPPIFVRNVTLSLVVGGFNAIVNAAQGKTTP